MSAVGHRHVAAATVAGVVLSLAGCSATDDGRSEAEAGALAAARAYVEAIANLDVETADAMTDPSVFELASGPDDDADIRAALPEAADPISDPWVSLVSPTYEASYGTVEYVVDVSYTIKGLTGGDTIVVTLDDGAEPEDVGSWTVTEALIVRGATYSDVPAARIGPVELTYQESHEGVWGYPGGYLLTAAEGTPAGDPLWIAVGAADAPPWDDSLPKLERPSSEEPS